MSRSQSISLPFQEFQVCANFQFHVAMTVSGRNEKAEPTDQYE